MARSCFLFMPAFDASVRAMSFVLTRPDQGPTVSLGFSGKIVERCTRSTFDLPSAHLADIYVLFMPAFDASVCAVFGVLPRPDQGPTVSLGFAFVLGINTCLAFDRTLAHVVDSCFLFMPAFDASVCSMSFVLTRSN